MFEKLNVETDFDVLGDIFTALRFRGSVFFRSELAAPWGISLPARGIPRFHIGLSGSCSVGSEKYEPVRVEENEIVLLPGGGEHWIADKPGRALVTTESAGQACELGNPLFQQGKITNQIMCGLVNYDKDVIHPIFDALPEVIHFQQADNDDPIWMTVKLMSAEIQRVNKIDDPIVDRLAEVLFLQLLYHHIENCDDTGGFLVALKDHRLRKAISLIHKMPNYNWSLDSLGHEIGMSRASLVRHFENAIGETPMSYIRNWRVTRAYNLVKYTATPIEQVATSVGFASAGSLNKAFQRYYPFTPAELRRASNH